MKKSEKLVAIEKFKQWYRDDLSTNHKKNTVKLKNPKELNVNPFLLHYLANSLDGNSDSKTLAKVLIYPRALGTSITTTFGSKLQKFITQELGATGSTTKGIDIEFIDQNDGRKKYCQLKSGPNALNKDDIKTIVGHFKGVKNLAKTNNLSLDYGDLIFALTYGQRSELNAFVRGLEEKDVIVLVGKEFWEALTGDSDFYKSLIQAASEVAQEFDMKDTIESVINELSEKIESRFEELSE